MAINTTGNNGSVVGVTGVHPDNMGNTLVFKNKVYNVNVGDTLTVGEDGLVDVKLSSDSGNLLEARGNGLYYGQTAVQTNYYVDSNNGSDTTGNGTRLNPYRTFSRVRRELKSQYNYSVFLEENGVYEWRSSDIVTLASLSIFPYGPMFDSANTIQKAGVDHTCMSSAIKRPTLNLVADRVIIEFGVEKYSAILAVKGVSDFSLKLAGINIVCKQYNTDRPMSVNNPFFFGTGEFFDGTIRLYGCDITNENSEPLLAKVSKIVLYNNLIKSGKLYLYATVDINRISIGYIPSEDGVVSNFPTSTGTYRAGSKLSEHKASFVGKPSVIVNANVISNVDLS